MKYDFETRIDRKERGNLKYIVFTPEILKEKDIPSYSGAEFEFRPAPCVMDAVRSAAENGCFGFTLADGNYRRHVAWWWKNVRGADVQRDFHAVSDDIGVYDQTLNDAAVEEFLLSHHLFIDSCGLINRGAHCGIIRMIVVMICSSVCDNRREQVGIFECHGCGNASAHGKTGDCPPLT